MTQDFDNEYIFRIVYLGDSQELSDILRSHPQFNINIQNENGESLLIHCVKRMETKWTALIGGEFRTICKTLIRRNIDVNIKDATDKTAANYAAELQQLEVLRLLIQNGAHIDTAVLDSVIDKEDWILAICASLAKDSEDGMSNAKVNSGENVKLMLFHRLLSSKYISSIRWMCELFPEIIEMKNEKSLTALHIVVIENNVDALKILLEFNANLEDMDRKGHTALHFAVDYGHIDCMLSLLNSGSAVNCQDDSGATPLHYAINVGSKCDSFNITSDMVDYLLKFGADTTVADRNGRLPLHWAANAGNAKVCLMMVANGSPVNSRCNDGYTALHIAANQGHAECIRILVMKCGADVDTEDKCGYTPLFNAIGTRNIHCAELLLYEDASPNHCNTQGNSPAHVAASKGITEALEVLVKYRGSLELKNNCGDMPIHVAALFLKTDVVNYLLGCQCNVNVCNKQGFTPLHLAASIGSNLMCQSLLEGGANLNCINIQSKNGLYKFLTPLDLARLNKRSQCVSYLEINGGSRGDDVVHVASKKIQRWWRKHRSPKIILSPTEEYNSEKKEGTSVQEIIQRNKRVTTSSKETETNPIPRKKGQETEDKLHNRKSETLSATAKTTITGKHTSCSESPIRKSARRQRNTTVGQQAVKITTSENNRTAPKKQVKEKEMKDKQEVPTSKLEKEYSVKDNFNDSLEMEISRREKFSKEIAGLKVNLEERTRSLEKRLQVIEQNLEKL